MTKLSRRDFLKFTGLGMTGAAAALALTACAKDDAGTTTGTTETTGTTTGEQKSEELIANTDTSLVDEGTASTETESTGYVRPTLTVLQDDPGTIPPYSPNMNGRGVLWSMYELLFEQPGFGMGMVPVLADESKGALGGYDHEEGTGIYTAYIYDYIHDHEGNPITADDVVFSYTNYLEQGSNIKKWVGCKAIDATTIEFEFESELVELMQLDGIWGGVFIISQKAWEAHTDMMTSTECGTGRYTATEFVGGSHIVMEKVEDYWQTNTDLIRTNQQANVQTVRCEFQSETAQKVIALQTEAVDMVESLPTEFVGEFLESEKYKVFSYKDNLTYYLLFNCSEDSIMHDINMRLAICYAVNIDGLVAAMGDGFGTRAYFMGNDNFSDVNPEWETWENYNTKVGDAEAGVVQGYLDAAGYKGETITLMAGTSGVLGNVIQVVQAQMLNYGITIDLQQRDGASLNVDSADPTKWDILCNMAASKGLIANVWGGNMLNASVSKTGLTTGFLDDPKLTELTSSILTFDGHTTENLDATWQYVVDNALVIGLFSQYNNMIIPADMTYIARNGKKWPIHGACQFEAPQA